MPKKKELDAFDCSILEILQKDASVTNKELAKQIGLSPPATLVRVNHLMSRAYLSSSSYNLNWSKLGFNYTVFVYCKVEKAKREAFLKLLAAFPQVLRLHEINQSEILGFENIFCWYLVYGVFRTQNEFQRSWTLSVLTSEVIVGYKALEAGEEIGSSHPVPISG